MTLRWVFTEMDTGNTYTVPINPNQMSSPEADKQLTSTTNAQGRIRAFHTPGPPKEWTWGGVIRTQAHYDALELWSRTPGVVQVTDHLGRTFEVLMQSFAPEDRKPTKHVPWRLRYQMKALVLRRVA